MRYTRSVLEELIAHPLCDSRVTLTELLEEWKRVPKTGDFYFLYPGRTVYFRMQEGEKWLIHSAVITLVDITTVRIAWDCKWSNEKHGDVYSTAKAADASVRLGTVLDAKINKIDSDGNQWVEIHKTLTVVFKNPGGLKDGKVDDPVTMTYMDGDIWRIVKR